MIVPTPLNTTAHHSSPECGFSGNPDIHGLGIRIGIYTQIVAVWFSNSFLLSQALILRDAVTTFSVAILTVSIIYAADPSAIHAVEAFILLQILAWCYIMGVQAKSSYTAGNFRGTLFRRVVNKAIGLCTMGLHVWFWWAGLDAMKKGGCGGTWMWYVVRTDMYGWARKVMMTFSLFTLVATLYWSAVGALRPWAWLKGRASRRQFVDAVRRWDEDGDRGKTRQEGDKCAERPSTERKSTDGRPLSHDGCSAYSCEHCSPVQRGFYLDREATLAASKTPVLPPSRPASPPASIPASSSLSSSSPTPPSLPLPTIPPPDPCAPEYAILQDVHAAELYIHHCISASPYLTIDGASRKPTFNLAMLRSLFTSPGPQAPCANIEAAQETTPGPSWWQCHVAVWRALLTLRLPAQTLALYSHLRVAMLMDPLNTPFQLHASLEPPVPIHISAHPIPTPSPSPFPSTLPTLSSITLASALLTTPSSSRSSSPSSTQSKKAWLGWYYALLDLLIHIIVMLQLELTLRWNRVSGLGELWGSVGQLIPFIVGVVGVVLVGGRWVGGVWEKRKGGRRVGREGWKGDRDRGRGGGDEEKEDEVGGGSGGEVVFGIGVQGWVGEGYARWKAEFEGVGKGRG
ncbi:hypothetical protein BDV95DRAFT_608300 [Massariosphaeria phaeospora]|uniref:Uncharacterized protein n=1 Tax=Massariosphaeria phaeospora TaxID=100035 RepID=A0A7C8MM48_9PLEO|nr:hypothetical protein BDV95DRAFT_608300 [Massariosphaeria phaeospora]